MNGASPAKPARIEPYPDLLESRRTNCRAGMPMLLCEVAPCSAKPLRRATRAS